MKVQIEKTSKPIKAKLLIGQVIFWLGVLTAFTGSWISGAVILLLGGALIIAGTIERWWQHD